MACRAALPISKAHPAKRQLCAFVLAQTFHTSTVFCILSSFLFLLSVAAVEVCRMHMRVNMHVSLLVVGCS